MCEREDRPNIKPQLVIGALKFAEFPEHISRSTQYDLSYEVLLIKS